MTSQHQPKGPILVVERVRRWGQRPSPRRSRHLDVRRPLSQGVWATANAEAFHSLQRLVAVVHGRVTPGAGGSAAVLRTRRGPARCPGPALAIYDAPRPHRSRCCAAYTCRTVLSPTSSAEPIRPALPPPRRTRQLRPPSARHRAASPIRSSNARRLPPSQFLASDTETVTDRRRAVIDLGSGHPREVQERRFLGAPALSVGSPSSSRTSNLHAYCS